MDVPIEGLLTATGALVGGIALAIERSLAVRSRSNGSDPTRQMIQELKDIKVEVKGVGVEVKAVGMKVDSLGQGFAGLKGFVEGSRRDR